MSPPIDSAIRRQLSWRKKLLFAVLTTIAFFVAIETSLVLLGIGSPADMDDPFVGFSNRVPLFETVQAADGSPWLQTTPGKLVWFNQQSFPAKKPANTTRIFCLGGSTTYGHPFADSTSFCGWLREFLPLVDSKQKWEVINAGGVSYASYRVAAVMEELAEYEPDLFIVYSVHNEFLERRTYAGMFATPQWNRNLQATLQNTRTWTLARRLIAKPERQPAKELLPAEVDEMLNHSVGPEQYHRDDEWAAKVVGHYQLNLQRMTKIAANSGAKIVFITPAANLRDCWPFKSEGDADEELIKKLDLAEEEPPAQALQLCDEVLKAEPRHALAHFLRGRSLFALQRFDEAEAALTRAMNEDVCPLRATTSIDQAVRRVADNTESGLVDFHLRLREQSLQRYGHACFGDESFLDHVHPTIDVHRDLAIWILDDLLSRGIVVGKPLDAAAIDAVKQRVEAGIDIESQCVAYRNLAKLLHWAGKFHEAIPRARDALDLVHEDLESRFVLADSLFNVRDIDGSLAEYKLLFTIGDFPRAYLPYGELLSRQGDYQAAEPYLQLAVLTDETHRARAHYSLGIVLLQLNEFAAASTALEVSNQLYPNDFSTLLLLAEAKTGTGDVEAAKTLLRQAIQLQPENQEVRRLLEGL
jgi:tetratricopeptide (TPR) repeat protein